MNYPKRLMGWVRAGANAYEVRLRHEPNLFQPNAYVIMSISRVELPLPLMLNPDKVIQVSGVGYEQPKRHVWVGYIEYFDGSILRESDYLTVEPLNHSDKVFYSYNERGGVRLRLKVIPDNIK